LGHPDRLKKFFHSPYEAVGKESNRSFTEEGRRGWKVDRYSPC
jgi:hypothetical protein